MRFLSIVSVLLLSASALTAHAEPSVEETIATALRTAQPNLVMLSATQVGDQALYEVELTSGEVLYTTANGQFFIYGSLFEASKEGLVNLTAKRGDEKRKELLATIDVKDMVVFPSKEEEKSVVTVFTDVDCGYCRKLHREVPRLNELGITVQYLAYPRAGIYTDQKRSKFTGSYKKLKSVWCDADRPAAMSKAKATGFIKENLNCDAPIEAQLLLGEKFGVRGTPALVLQGGQLIPGYMPANELAKKLGL